MKFEDFDHKYRYLAESAAITVNGGDWEKDYTDAQKVGWVLKAKAFEILFVGEP